MEKVKNRILVADDEKDILELLIMLLEAEGYDVVAVHNGKEAVDCVDQTIDLCVLDVNMPEMNGFSAAAEIRKRYYMPIIFLTAYSGESEKMMGYSAGADDYIVKPFSNVELLLRVKSLLRRVQQYSITNEMQETVSSEQLKYKDLLLDFDAQSVKKGEEVIVLTHTEFKILELLMTHQKKIFSLDSIYQSIWQDDAVGDSAIMVHIKNIRKKLGDDSRNPRYIRTAWGKGYYVE
ncbi:MAG: response regulator transcription factor [Peptococcaceae bacterium]|nr:response regulator transcription factor [Peptococcaceae bacterium]